MGENTSTYANKDLFDLAYGKLGQCAIAHERNKRPNEDVTMNRVLAQWGRDYYLSKEIETLYNRWMTG